MTGISKKQEWSPPASFEEGLEKLEMLIARLEEGNIPLKEAMDTFKRASRLAQWCNTKLKDAEKSIKQLVKIENKFKLEEIEHIDVSKE